MNAPDATVVATSKKTIREDLEPLGPISGGTKPASRHRDDVASREGANPHLSTSRPGPFWLLDTTPVERFALPVSPPAPRTATAS